VTEKVAEPAAAARAALVAPPVIVGAEEPAPAARADAVAAPVTVIVQEPAAWPALDPWPVASAVTEKVVEPAPAARDAPVAAPVTVIVQDPAPETLLAAATWICSTTGRIRRFVGPASKTFVPFWVSVFGPARLTSRFGAERRQSPTRRALWTGTRDRDSRSRAAAERTTPCHQRTP